MSLRSLTSKSRAWIALCAVAWLPACGLFVDFRDNRFEPSPAPAQGSQGASPGEPVSACPGVDRASDPHHCGRCGHDCLGGLCEKGRCQAVCMRAIGAGSSLAVDDRYVYWVRDLYDIYRANKMGDGSDAVRLAGIEAGTAPEEYITQVLGLLASDEDLFWLASAMEGPDSIRSCRKSRCTSVTVLASDAQPTDFPVLWDHAIYWPDTNGLFRVSKDGVRTRISEKIGWSLVANDDGLWLLRGPTHAQEITQFDFSGQPRRTVSGLSLRARFAMQGDQIFASGEGIARIAWRDGAQELFVPKDRDARIIEPDAIAVDATSVYWVDAVTHSLWRTARDRPSPELMFEADVGEGSPLVMDGERFYFWNRERSRICRLAK